MMNEMQCELEQLTGRIIFMSMYNDIVWEIKTTKELCIANSKTVAANIFSQGHWSFLGHGSEKKWYGSRTRTSRMENGMMSLSTFCSIF